MQTPDHVYGVILAGGSGTRFWPKSRKLTPKQLQVIGGGNKTMIEQTLQRLNQYIPAGRRIIVTHIDQVSPTRKIVNQDLCAHLIAEPMAKNTANALALAAFEIKALYQGEKPPIMISLHADHVIGNVEVFQKDLMRAISIAEHGYLTLLGIKPSRPDTGFGYIERGEPLSGKPGEAGGFKVATFREKPSLEVAKQYLSSGKFYWNSGYFVWRVDVILEEIQKHLPKTFQLLSDLTQDGRVSLQSIPTDALQKTYAALDNIAIDNAVLEVSQNVAVVEGDFDWNDLGSWDALDQSFPTDASGNLTSGDVFMIDCKNTTVDSDKDFIACIGLEDVVVVSHQGAILVCRKDCAQDVKKVVEHLRSEKRTDLL